MRMKTISRCLFIGMLLILGSGFFCAHLSAQDAAPEDVVAGIPLLEGTAYTKKQYLVRISGTVMNETFTGAQALLTLSGPLRGTKYNNPYLIIIEGFPKQNSINSFYWDSEDSEMRALVNEVTCDIKRSVLKPTSQYFYSLSPELLRISSGLGSMRLVEDVKKDAEKVALPTRINSRAGQLKLRIHSSSLSGSVWMKGYDEVEKSFVQYSARLQGVKVYGMRPMLDQKKRTVVRE